MGAVFDWTSRDATATAGTTGSAAAAAAAAAIDGGDAKLRALYRKAKAYQWDGDSLAWDTPIDPSGCPLGAHSFGVLELPIFNKLSKSQRELLNAHLTTLTLSQFLHGEQGALLVASQLAQCVPDLEAKLCAAMQTADEARHVEVFTRYVKRCAEVHPIRSKLRETLEAIVGQDEWAKKLVGMQVIVEGLALTSFHEYRRDAQDKLLHKLLELVIRDEARHVAFAPLYLKTALDKMHPDDKEALADFAFDITLGFKALAVSYYRDSEAIFEKVGISFEDVMRSAFQSSLPKKQLDAINAFIVPALARFGVITPRAQKKFDQARMLDERDRDLWAAIGLGFEPGQQ
jgi:hypothetical protein